MDKLRVLYVDDEPDIREVAAMSLGLDPHLEVRAADSGASALALLEEDQWRPDAILLDMMMPALDGPGTLAKLRQLPHHRTTPVIFITARAQSHEQARLVQLGAVGVITKPFDPMSLAAHMRSLLVQDAA